LDDLEGQPVRSAILATAAAGLLIFNLGDETSHNQHKYGCVSMD